MYYVYMYTLDVTKSNGGLIEEDAKNYVDLQHDAVQYFSLVQLAKATDNFKLENKIGQGGFGIVYLVNSFLFLCTKVHYRYPHDPYPRFEVQILLGTLMISSYICDYFLLHHIYIVYDRGTYYMSITESLTNI